ncbi:MAG: cell division protein SepF [Clostridia bacterium]|nr:cell division protein SepF [Clostridia bacterium]
MFDKWQEKLKAKNRAIEEEEIEFKNLDESTEAAFTRAEPEREEEIPAAPSSIEGSNIALKVVRPEGFGEVSSIADYLIEGCTVVLNTELIDKTTTIRMLDFLNGVTYTKDGEIKNVAPNTYIITPSGIDIRD